MKNPCYKCADRHFKCHAACKKYKAWLECFHAMQKEVNGITAYRAERRNRIESSYKKGSSKYKSYFKKGGGA